MTPPEVCGYNTFNSNDGNKYAEASGKENPWTVETGTVRGGNTSRSCRCEGFFRSAD